MIAGGCAYFGRELAAAVGWTAGSFSASSGLGSVASAQYFVHNNGGAPSAGAAAVPDEGSGVYGAIGGMDRRTSFAGYGSAPLPMATAAPARPPPLARANGPLIKASWTEEEDEYVLNRSELESFLLVRRDFLLQLQFCFFVVRLQDSDESSAGTCWQPAPEVDGDCRAPPRANRETVPREMG
jgi:hypothetical protein